MHSAEELPLAAKGEYSYKLFDFLLFTFNYSFSFDINFKYLNESNDIALHINPRLRTKAIVRNTRVNGKWGREELYLSHPFMFRPGDRFEIRVLVTDDCYLIAINGHHFAQYMHRQPYGAIRLLEIHGDLTEVQIQRSRVRGYPNCIAELEVRIKIILTAMKQGN